MRLPMPAGSGLVLIWLLLTDFNRAVRFALRDLLLSLRSVCQKQMVRMPSMAPVRQMLSTLLHFV